MTIAQQRVEARSSKSDCGECSDSAACENCGTPKNDPTHKRAEWAALVAGNDPSQSEFFRTAMMADAFFRNDAGGWTPSAESSVSRGLLTRQQFVTSFASALEQLHSV